MLNGPKPKLFGDIVQCEPKILCNVKIHWKDWLKTFPNLTWNIFYYLIIDDSQTLYFIEITFITHGIIFCILQ